jgi:CubicO group peptidase (beta-lactamase class C family)
MWQKPKRMWRHQRTVLTGFWLAVLAAGATGPPAAVASGDDDRGQPYFVGVNKSMFTDSIALQQRGRDAVTQVARRVGFIRSDGGSRYELDVRLSRVQTYSAFLASGRDPQVSWESFDHMLDQVIATVAPEDTVVIYTHTHGFPLDLPTTEGGMLFAEGDDGDEVRAGVYPWRRYADKLLRIPAKNVVVLTTACFSGALVEVLNEDEMISRWINRDREGRNFIVITSQDGGHPSNPTTVDGSRINPLTYALLGSFAGQADSPFYPSGGRVTFGGFVDRTVATAESFHSGGFHSAPQVAGSYRESDVFFTIPATRPDLSDRVARRAREENLPSLVVGYTTRDSTDVVMMGDRGDGVSPTAETAYPIGSVSKLLTALLMAQAVNERRIAPDSRVEGSVPPEIREYMGARTFLDLVNHYGGYKTLPMNVDFEIPDHARGYTLEELALCLSMPGCSETGSGIGTEYVYSNLGVGILGLALSGVQSTDIDRMFDGLFESLGILGTVFARDVGVHSTEDVAQGSLADGAPYQFATMGVLACAGEFVSSGNDMVRLLEALVFPERFPSSSGFVEIVQDVQYAQPSRIGTTVFGIDLTEWDGTTIYSKSGSTPVSAALIRWNPTAGTGVIVMTNIGGRSAALDHLADDILEILGADVRGQRPEYEGQWRQ